MILCYTQTKRIRTHTKEARIVNRYIDLHTHSYYSDGTDSPEKLVGNAKGAGLDAIALTDHDSVSGLREFAGYGNAYGIETVDGIEISSQMGDIEAHMLGYFIDSNANSMKNYLIGQEASRSEKTAKTLRKLQDMGFSISKEDFTESKGIITRGSIAGVMHRKGFVGYKKEAFEKYIGEGRPAFFDRERISAAEAVRLILDCNGIPVIAHPYLYEIDDGEFESELRKLTSAGLRGIEVLYPERYSKEREMFYRDLAGKYSLLITGGSDYHGDNKKVALGRASNNERIPYSLLETLRAARCCSGGIW